MIEGFNCIQNNVKDMNKNINIKIKDVNDNTIEVRYKINKNTFNAIKNITGLNNLYLQQFSKTNDELRKQDNKNYPK